MSRWLIGSITSLTPGRLGLLRRPGEVGGIDGGRRVTGDTPAGTMPAMQCTSWHPSAPA